MYAERCRAEPEGTLHSMQAQMFPLSLFLVVQHEHYISCCSIMDKSAVEYVYTVRADMYVGSTTFIDSSPTETESHTFLARGPLKIQRICKKGRTCMNIMVSITGLLFVIRRCIRPSNWCMSMVHELVSCR